MFELVAKRRFAYTAFAVFAVIYSILTLGVRPSPQLLQLYHISELAARVFSLTVVLPFLVIWLVALVGSSYLVSYTSKLRDGMDAKAFRTISYGILGLTFWLPFTGILGSLGKLLYRNDPTLTPVIIRFQNYANLFWIGVSFILIYLGSRLLVRIVNNPPYTSRQWTYASLTLGVILAYVLFVLQDPARVAPPPGVSVATFYTSDWITFLTLILPRCVVWVLSFMAVRNILVYASCVKGSIYRSSMQLLGWGLSGVVVSFIFLRFLETLTVQINNSLAFLLLAIYLILLGMGLGYLGIARGAKQLQKIEEV